MIFSSTARFNVGSLLLTTADPKLDANSDFMPTAGQFQLVGTAGAQPEIVIQAGAQLNATTTGQSNYIVALAPRVQQDGAISVRGSAALVAAEGATFAIDSKGLFTISVDAANQGSTVTSTDALSHTGSTGGPDAGTALAPRRVYLMAVPKNNAITMAIQSGGSLGFAIAGAANVSGNAIVLSGGRNITDTGSGNPISGTSLINQPVTINIARGSYTSGAWVGSNDTVNIADAATGGTPDIKFAGQLNVTANTVNMNLTQGSNSVGGILTLDASGDLVRPAGATSLSLDGASTTLTVGNRVDLFARNGPLGTGSTSAAAFYNTGGTATLSASNGAVLSATGNIRLNANALGQTSGAYPASGPSTGGSSTITASGGGQILSTGGGINAIANGFGLTATGGSVSSLAVDAIGGTAQVTAIGTQSLISGALGVNIQAGGTGGLDTLTGNGGNATGGTATLTASAGGRIVGGGSVSVAADGIAGNGGASGGSGGNATGGSAQISAADGTIADGTLAGFAATALLAEAGAQGGNGTFSGTGGSATGGSALLQTGGLAGKIDAGAGITVAADATGGSTNGAIGGSATAGTATFGTTGTGQAIGSAVAGAVTVTALATLGSAPGGIAGDATGGTVKFQSAGGTIAATTLTLNATTAGDSTSFNAGETAAGTVNLDITGGGQVTALGAVQLLAGVSSSSQTDPLAGSLSAGHIVVDNQNGALRFGSTTTFDVGYTINGSVTPAQLTTGTALVKSAPSTSTAFGTGPTGAGNIDIAQTTLGGAGDYSFSAAGNINLASGALFGSANNISAALLSDSGGTGIGTVYFANGAIALSGTGSSASFFYNPASFGTPTDFSPAMVSGAWTGFQLVNNLTDLQNINSYLTQNFALGKSLDAGVTLGWNNGAGFVPLGTDNSGTVLNGGNGFTGKFHGLGHVVSNLYINRGSLNNVGLFGYAGAGSLVRSVGVVGGLISGGSYTGALVGQGLGAVRRGFSSTTVSGTTNVGGLIGGLGAAGVADESFSTSSVSGGDNTGGLIGLNAGDVVKTYASGAVAGGNNVGGLIGNSNTGTGPNSVRLSYATGAAQGTSNVGGLIGNSVGTVSEGYASGPVTGSSAGGLFGSASGTFTALYWDSYSTGQGNAFSSISGTINSISSVTSDPQQAAANNWAFSPSSYTNFNGINWYSFNNATRPVGLWESPDGSFQNGTIYSVHQLAFVGGLLTKDFKLGADIDASETQRLSGIWGTGGAFAIGESGSRVANVGAPYSGTFDGAGHVIANLKVGQGGNDLGLFAVLAGTVRNLGVVDAVIGTGSFRAGAIAGTNNGLIQNSFATGTVSANHAAGGLVGSNGLGGTISNSYASVAATGVQIDGTPTVGGLAGTNFGKIDLAYANGIVAGGTLGGLVGSNDASATITHSYWNTQLTGQALACGLDAGSQCGVPVGLTNAQANMASSYAGWSMDSAGGQNAVWRIYEGSTAPLLKVFLRPFAIDAGNATLTYNGTVPTVLAPVPGAIDTNHLFGLGTTSGAGRNAGSYTLTYAGGFYSDQTGYDLVIGAPATLTINPAALTLNAATDSRGYDATASSGGTVGIVGLQTGDTVTGLVQSFDSANAGARTLSVNAGYTINDGNNGANYTVTLNTAAGTITPAALNLAAVADTRTYNATAASQAAPSITGLFGNDSVIGLTQSFDSKNAGTRTLSINPGYVVNDGNNGGNYTVTTATAAGQINPALLTLAAATDSRTYTGTTASAATPTASGLQGSDTVTGLTQAFDLPLAGARNLLVNSGYTVNDGNNGANYTVQLTTAAGTITPAPLTITANNRTLTYSGLINLNGLSVTTSGFVNGEGLNNLNGAVGYGGTSLTARNVGTYSIIPQGPTSTNYAITFVAGTTTITPAALTLNAVADSKVYNSSAVSTAAPTVSGLVGSDTVSGLAQSFDSANAGARTLGVNSGYTINDGNGGANYTVTANTAAGSITPAAAKITYTANPASSIYGNVPTGLTGSVGVTPLFGNDTLATITTGTAAFTTPAGPTSAVGRYAINGGGLSAAGGNYAITFAQAAGNATALTITPRLLTVTANALSRAYGDPNPALTYAVGGLGLVNGDQLSGALVNAATATSAVGSYKITQGTLAATGNYTLNYVANNLTVTPRPITVTADSFSRAYGDANPALTYTVGGQGLVNGDTVSGALATSAGLTSPVGSYAVTQGSVAASSNYALTFVAGNIAVTARPVTITATSLARFTTDPNPALTYTVGGRGLVNGDQLSGALATSATAASPPGPYPITQGTLAATSNYAVTYVPGVLTVNACVLSAGCSADVSGQVIQQIAPAVTPPPPSPAAQTPQQQQQEQQQQEQEKKETAKADNSGKPQVVAQTLVNTGGLNTPPPVNEPVTGTGNFNVDVQTGTGGPAGGGGASGAPPAGNASGLDGQGAASPGQQQ